jgi:hypothetical protein
MFACSPSAFADLVGTFVPLTSESGFAPPTGYVTQDLVISTATDWLAANLLVHLDSGSFYQDPLLVGFGPPSPALVAAVPSTRWDTYVTGSGGLAGGAPASAGGAVDLGGGPVAVFGGSDINLNWFTTSATDIGTFSIGRFTLSEDAVGTYELRLDALGQTGPTLLSGSISNGRFAAVPEASTFVLMTTAAGGALFLRRRRSHQEPA